ncbi:hypothetical protein QYE76_031581 [Lolium multiflorum]|uniref:Retrotransposon gag domain-containing protein n=1 Tax=Lolium multiflorum TaxID=4521 RepID=A0AAD8VKK4_LOLMU|nr:hypothetical protein QYE76_031581 [Lolium multiflorum]
MEIIIALVDRTLVMMILAPTQGVESSIAMLVLMNVRNKNKLFTKIVIKRLAMPTMGMTTNPKTTSSTTWTRHLIVKPMWMLKTKVIKIHQGVISGIILAMTKGAEDNLNMIKMREPTLDNVNNLDKIRNNILNMSQVKLVFNSNANPMLWNMEDEENMYGKLKFNMPKFKGEDDAEAYLSWALKVDKIFRIHNYSGAKKVAMASLEFEDYANTWWEQVVTLREEKGDPPIDTWEDMKEEMEARFVPKHYKTDLFNKLQKLKQGTKTVEEFFKEMELTMMRANIQESENQTIARFFNGLNYPIKRIVEFQQYSNMVELVHQASKAERQVNEDIKYSLSPSFCFGVPLDRENRFRAYINTATTVSAPRIPAHLRHHRHHHFAIASSSDIDDAIAMDMRDSTICEMSDSTICEMSDSTICELDECLHFESMSDAPSSMDDETPIMEKMYMVHEDDDITPCLLEDEHGGHMEPTTSTTPTSYEWDYKGTQTPMSTSIEHELTKRALESMIQEHIAKYGGSGRHHGGSRTQGRGRGSMEENVEDKETRQEDRHCRTATTPEDDGTAALPAPALSPYLCWP